MIDALVGCSSPSHATVGPNGTSGSGATPPA
jgi:hypothetical protein